MAIAGTALLGFGVEAQGSDAVGTAMPPLAAATTTTVPPETTTTTVPPETTTTTAPPETTTTIAPPETTTTTAPPPPVTTTTAPARTPAAAPLPNRQALIEGHADSTGWDWRTSGVGMTVAYHPEDCCHWGVYDSRRRVLYIGPNAFRTDERLRYVVLHELAHAWQYQTGRFTELIADYKAFGVSGTAAALEAGADCIARVWGAVSDHYWRCPDAAAALAARRLGGDWR
jgi:hypothetical protein